MSASKIDLNKAKANCDDTANSSLLSSDQSSYMDPMINCLEKNLVGIFKQPLVDFMFHSTDQQREICVREVPEFFIKATNYLMVFIAKQDTYLSIKDTPVFENKQKISTLQEKAFSFALVMSQISAAACANTDAVVTEVVDNVAKADYYLRYLLERVQTKRAFPTHLSTLVNFTRYEPFVDILLKLIPTEIDKLVDILVSLLCTKKQWNTGYSQCNQNFVLNEKNLVAAWLTNLTQVEVIRHTLIKRKQLVPLLQLFNDSVDKQEAFHVTDNIRQCIVSIVRNCCFESKLHEMMFDKNNDQLIVQLMLPLTGVEELPLDEIEELPFDLQYLPLDKKREQSSTIRTLLCEALLQLCATRYGRTVLRDQLHIYYLLREYHKWEHNAEAKVALENLIDVLIKKEEELDNINNLKEVDIPTEFMQKFAQIDIQLLNDAKVMEDENKNTTTTTNKNDEID